jgi:hypothetical protein
MYHTFLTSIIGDSEFAEKILKLSRKKSADHKEEIDYLKDNCLVLFAKLSGTGMLRIDYVKGADTLGYRIVELVGTDILSLFPVKYKSTHADCHLFFRFLLPVDHIDLQSRTGVSFFIDNRGFLIQFRFKIRLVIDHDAELFLVILA